MAAASSSIPQPLLIASDAAGQLAVYLKTVGKKPLLVADERTLAAWPLDELATGTEVLVLKGEPVANERFVELVSAALRPDTLPLALGAGTLTDIVRYAAFQKGLDWVAVPTAPSVDGFVSSVAAMTWGGAKISSPASPPVALFASPEVLAAAPRALIAAGVGDILGKFTSVADWKLGALLYGEPYSQPLAEQTLGLAATVAGLAPAIGRGESSSVGRLMDALVGSGLVMLEQGDSRPASGSEHHIAHVWEMKLLREGRSPVLHGAKVGVASVYAAKFWKRIANMTIDQARLWTGQARLPLASRDEAIIRSGFGAAAESLLESRKAFRPWTEASFGELMHQVLERWDDIRAIAAEVPSPEQLTSWLRASGGPTEPAELGLADDLDEALRLGPYLRDRFTVARLLTLLGVDLAVLAV